MSRATEGSPSERLVDAPQLLGHRTRRKYQPLEPNGCPNHRGATEGTRVETLAHSRRQTLSFWRPGASATPRGDPRTALVPATMNATSNRRGAAYVRVPRSVVSRSVVLG